MKIKWTPAQIADFIQWHGSRLIDCGYPASVVLELRNARIKWLGE